MTAPRRGDTIRFKTAAGDVSYEIIRVPGEEDGPPKGTVDVGRSGPGDPVLGNPVGLALTIDLVVWQDLVALTGGVTS